MGGRAACCDLQDVVSLVGLVLGDRRAPFHVCVRGRVRPLQFPSVVGTDGEPNEGNRSLVGCGGGRPVPLRADRLVLGPSSAYPIAIGAYVVRHTLMKNRDVIPKQPRPLVNEHNRGAPRYIELRYTSRGRREVNIKRPDAIPLLPPT